MNDHLGALVNCDTPRSVNCICLSIVNARQALIALTAHTPTAVGGNHMLIFTHDISLLSERPFS